MKRILILSFLFASFTVNAQWTIRQLGFGLGSVVFGKQNNAIIFGNAPKIYFGDRSNLVFDSSESTLNKFKLLHLDQSLDNRIFFSSDAFTQINRIGYSDDSMKTHSFFNFNASINRVAFDMNCMCRRLKSFALRDNIASHYFGNNKFVLSIRVEGSQGVSPDSSSGVIFLSGAQTIGSQTPTYYAINNFSFPNNDELGYAAGLRGWVGKTRDSGKTFTSVLNFHKRNFHLIEFADSSNGWVYGFHLDTLPQNRRTLVRYPLMMYTPDGGQSWIDLPYDTSYFVTKMKFVSPTTGYALFFHRFNNTTYFGKTTNAGQSWAVEWGNNQVSLSDFEMLDSSNIALVGYSSVVTGGLYITKGTILGLKPTPSDRLYTATPQPNPTGKRFTIPGVGREGVLSLVNASGRVVRQESFVPGSEVDISALPKGLYLFRLVSEGSVTQGKVVRE